MQNTMLADYLTKHNVFFVDSFLAENLGGKFDNNYQPSEVAQITAGFLIEIEKVDTSLLKAICANLNEQLDLFFSSQGVEHSAYIQKRVSQYLHLALVSAITHFITPDEEGHGRIFYQQKSEALSLTSALNFVEAIPELQSPDYVYGLPRLCLGFVSREISYFHPVFSSTQFADKRKLFAALIEGYGVENDDSGLLTSAALISEFGLSDNHALAIKHNSEKNVNCHPLRGALRFAKGIRPDSASRQLPSIFELTQHIGWIDPELVRAEISANKKIGDYLPNTIVKEIAYIGEADSVREAMNEAQSRLKVLGADFSNGPSLLSDNPFGFMISYAVCVVSVLEGVVQRFDHELRNILRTPNKSSSDYLELITELYSFFERVSHLMPTKDSTSHVKSALISLDESLFSNLCEGIFRIFNDDALTMEERSHTPARLINSFMPPLFKLTLLKKGLSADFALLTVGIRASIHSKSYPDLNAAVDSVMDYLLEIERQHPGLIFKVGGINGKNCASQGVNINFEFGDEDEFATFHLIMDGNSGIKSETFEAYLKSRLMSRIANEITLAALNEPENHKSDADADMGFLRHSSI